MFLVIQEQHFTPRFNPLLLFISESHGSDDLTHGILKRRHSYLLVCLRSTSSTSHTR